MVRQMIADSLAAPIPMYTWCEVLSLLSEAKGGREGFGF
jgi:hypothetical protein